MGTKRLFFLLMAMVLTFSVVGLSCSSQEIKGTISKIEGDTLGIVDDMGKEKIVKVEDLESLKEVKVGERVLVKDGRVTKEGG